MKSIQQMFNTSKRSVCKVLALLLFTMGFLPYVPAALPTNAEGGYEVVYNPNPAWHYDGILFEPGQWQGYFMMEGRLFHHEEGEMPPIEIKSWNKVTIKTVARATTNFTVPEVGVKLNTVAFCLKPLAPNWPNDINVYEITPELCNEFTDVSDHQVDERDIDALHIAMETMGLNKDAVNVSNETYAAMRMLTWYVGMRGWKNTEEFMSGIRELRQRFEDGGKVNYPKFEQICQKAADNIDRSIGEPETGLTDYMPAFTGRYSSNAPVVAFESDGSGAYVYEYTYSRKYDRAWEYQCPAGVMVSYGADSVTFTSSVPEPEGVFEGSVRPGSKLDGIIPAGGILICKSDEPERQDMLIPYRAPEEEVTCYFKAKAGSGGGGSASEFPTLPDVEYFKYEETMETHYNITGEKFDAETNQPLSRAEFEVFEQSPSGQAADFDNAWGSGIDIWTDWKRCKWMETDTNGRFAHTDTHTYDYVGTYCGGHDAGQKTMDDYRTFIAKCEEENADAEPDPDNPDAEPKQLWDTAAMNSHLAELEGEYQEQIEACEGFAGAQENHFFHEVEGEDGQKTGMAHDKQNVYDQFVNLEYDYTIREIRTHSGYTIHGEHGDDNPLPVIRTASSESGKTGYIIEADNKNVGLPATYEHAKGTRNTGAKPGTLTRASKWLTPAEPEPGPPNIKAELDWEASASDAEISTQSIFDLRAMGRTFRSLHTSSLKASGSDAEEPTGSAPEETPEATPSDALFRFAGDSMSSVRSMDTREVASWEPDWQRGSAEATDTGAGGVNLFTWYIYDHRIEGEVHINKRDMELLAGERAGYHSYGDTQGDATLEGAVYGLYAAQDIIHPDGKSGAVFKANDLVSIAATDKKGDASFLTITETSDTSGTLKNNYDGTQTDGNNPGVYPNNLALNGNQWIGRPLILGRYYIKEINRSEGYELSITGADMADTNRGAVGTVTADHGSAHVDNLRAGAGETSGTSGSVIEIKTEHAVEGVELYLYNYPADTRFGIMRSGTTVKPGQSVTGWSDQKTYVAGNGTHVYRNASGSGKSYYAWQLQGDGNYVRYETDAATPLYEQHKVGEEKKDAAGNRIPMRDLNGDIVYTAIPESKTLPYAAYKETVFKDVVIPGEVKNVRTTTNRLLKEAGYYSLVPPSTKAPWEMLTLTGTAQKQVEAILTWYKNHGFYNAACVESVTDAGDGTFTARIRYDYLAAGAAASTLYGEELYVKEIIPEGNGLYYFVRYPDTAYTLDKGMASIRALRLITEPITTADVIADHIKLQFVPQYETYPADEAVLDALGNPVPVIESVPEISENTSVTDTKTIDYLTDIAEYIPEKRCFKVLIRPERMTDEEKNGWLKIETVHTGLGTTVNGQKLQTGDVLKYVMGISAAAAVPSEDWTGTYIKDVLLTYDGQFSELYEDADTRMTPVPVEERIIKQRVKVTKDILTNGEGTYNNNTNAIHEDWFTRFLGGLEGAGTTAKKLENFRFKTYLKSNLEQLYRDSTGAVTWQDRNGSDLQVDASGSLSDFKEPYPALVQDIYTKVLHETDPLHKDSADAIVANDALYDYTNDLIHDAQNSGYSAILETAPQVQDDGTETRTVPGYNYKKLFDALAVANNDKWQDGHPTYTSWSPIGNEANRTEAAIENARASDMVRQFAIIWYLDDEVAKLTRPVTGTTETEAAYGNVTHAGEVYELALRQAIMKTNNYLKPFFSYDLDRIYAVEWDGSTQGGNDHDTTTLSADTLFGEAQSDSAGYYFGISKALPYGTYVIAEQQPRYTDLNDFANKHYRIDEPKEVTLPSVYESYAAAQAEPEELNSYYRYNAADMPEELATKYSIRFNEEAHVIRAHNADGDFEVYKHGLSVNHVENGSQRAQAGDYFALTQAEYKPYQDYYNVQDDRLTGNVPYYLTEGQSGRERVSKYYRYSSVAERAGTASNVAFPGAAVTVDNPAGIIYRDNVAAMGGMQTAYDGLYAPMLVPWSVTEPDDEAADTGATGTGESTYEGFGYQKFHNRFYGAKLRIEKLDSETHESILHDGAIFNLYAAERNDSAGGDGSVQFYEEETIVYGSREFLTAMGAENIQPWERDGIRFSGLVPAGTPICLESEQIRLTDETGSLTGEFKSFVTVADESMPEPEGTVMENAGQTVGYLETPKPLGAGVYVLAEAKPPVGYTRTKPVAIEIYSDKVAYYKEGNRDNRVTAGTYEYRSDTPTAHGNKPEDVQDVAAIPVENTPIKLTVEKLKESSAGSADTTADKSVTYKVSGRIEGSLAEIGNRPDYEYAYTENGMYLGYAWKKGTLEHLAARQSAGELVEPVYNGTVFAGYGYVTRPLETADDENKYVAGATMTLFDAIPLTPSGDTEDHAFKGLNITRNGTGNIERMYVEQNYAGSTVEFVRETEDGASVWTAKTVQRADTDILYYDLESLDITTTKTVDGQTMVYGYDKNHSRIPLAQIESDKQNHDKTDTEHAIYAFKGGSPYLEFVGGDFTKIVYSAKDKSIAVGEGTLIYHIDRDGNRDALLDPHTGMAYVTEQYQDADGRTQERTLVWPVRLAMDEYGHVIARDKITTSRLATVGENQDGYAEDVVIDPDNPSGTPIPDGEKPSYIHFESGYITGTWESGAGEESHRESTLQTNKAGQNMNDSVLIGDDNGTFAKRMNPVYDAFGLPRYYQWSTETYDKGTALYDRNGDFVRYKDSDQLPAYNRATYRILSDGHLHDGDPAAENPTQEALYHRQGESYVLENTWVTSDKTPNDPFQTARTSGQPDVLKRIPAGTYILEELRVPEGYLKGVPAGITVEETTAMHHADMVDQTVKVEIPKVDGAQGSIRRLDRNTMDAAGNPVVLGTATEGKGTYSYRNVPGAVLALYAAEKVYTADGYYLKRDPDAAPVEFDSTEHRTGMISTITAQWTTGTAPIYVEGLPEGDYLLEERSAPSGFVTSPPVEVHVSNTKEVQIFPMHDDHTKVEVEKYVQEDGARSILQHAGFTLFDAVLDAQGNVVFENGVPQYHPGRVLDTWASNDATDFTETINLKDYPNTSGQNEMTGFTKEFEAMYRTNGTKPGTGVQWSVKRSAVRSSATDHIWKLEDGSRVSVVNGAITFPDGMDTENRDGFEQALLANVGNKDEIQWAVEKSAQYVSHLQIDSSTAAGGAGATNFPTSATLYFRTADGMDIRITAYQPTADRQGRSFTFEYQFDYKKLDAVNAFASSYLTPEGRRRFDYLPTGNQYVLVETKVPEGFAKAADSVIEVRDMPDVQYYDIENEVSAIRISKVSGSGSTELAGAKLGLYRADAADGFTQSDELLVTSWTTGTDGTYSEEDFINNRIPDGYVQGDFRPHTITRLADGTYYLAELASPDYYTMFAPIRIDYKQEDAIRIIRAGNVPAEGELVIEKIDPDGNALRGAVFEVKAYRKNGELAFETTAGATTGTVTLKHLPVGETTDHGSVQPYLYKVRETISPDGYAVNTLLETFSFAPSKNGVSYAPGEAAVIRLRIKNEPIRLYIEKRDFDRLEVTGADGIFVDGAVLAVYEVHGKDEEDNYIYSESDLFTTWTTKEGARHLIKGLVAGRSYLLKELKAPAGYNLMEPVIFTVSSDGRKISRLTNDLNTISVNYIQMSDAYTDTDNRDLDSINSVTISGRYVSKTEMEMTDQDGTVVAGWISTGAGQTLTPAADIVDGEVYTFTERTCYSDGTMMVTGKTTRRIHFDEQGMYHVADRAAKQVTLALKKAADGTLIRDYSPSEYFTSETIKNNVNPENPKITMMNREGKVGDAIDPNQAVWNRIFYVNTANITTDITVTAKLDRTVQVIDVRGGVGDTDGGRVEGDSITWIIRDVKPLHGGYVSFATEVSDRSAYAVSVKATLAFNGKTVTGTKETPILQPNRLTLVNELTGSGKELYADEESTFRVRLYSATGTELKGSYRYAGSRTGELKSGETITLSGNEFITIHPGSIYKNIRYQVERIPDGKTVTQRNAEGTVPESAGACYVASRSVSDTKDRELFEKGERYILLETTEYTDQEIMESNKINFTLNEQAGIDGIGGYDKQTKVQIEKLDYDTGKPVTGAMMQILDRSGAIVEEWETTAAPHVLTGRLAPGERYLLRETKAPEGYGYAKDIWFTVNRDGTMDTIIMEDRQTNVVVSKLDAESLNGLLGAVMAIVDQDGTEVERWVSTGQPHVIRGKLTADAVYTLVEITPPDGSAPAKDITFTVSHDGTQDSIVMYDPPTKLLVKKLVATSSDARPGEPLTGATLQILHEDKTPATASNASPDFEPGEELIFTSQETFVRMLRQLIAGRTYYLHEVTPAPGYAYAEDVPFTVSMDGTQDVVVMYDLPTGVSIDKQNRADGQGITGAVMQLLDPAGRIIKEWVSTGKSVLFLGELIAKATYTLREVKAPEGYAHAEDMTFTVSKDGSHDMVVMYDEPTEVSILKVEASTGKPLAGALMQVVDPVNAAVMDEWESTTEPHSIKGKLTADKSYLLREIKAPSGYGLQRDLEFKVPYGAETVKLTFDNRRLMPPEAGDEFLDFKKISTDETPLAGAEFTFYREDGSVYAQAVSNSRGIISMVKPGDGTYTYRETKAPDGYLLNPDVYSFTVQYGSVITERLPVINHKSPEVVIEKTDAVTNGRVGGAVIRVWDDAGWSIQETTREDGTFSFPAPHAGVFHLQETAPPSGYRINTAVYDFTVHPDGAITGTTTVFDYPEGTPSPGDKIGKVTASYTSALSGRGYHAFGTMGNVVPGIPRTGDASMSMRVLGMIFISFLLICGWVLCNMRYKKDGKKKKYRWGKLFVILLLAFLFSVGSDPVAYASQSVYSDGTLLYVQSPPFTDAAEHHPAAPEYVYRGHTYRLKSYEVLDQKPEERQEQVSDTICYEAVEEADRIPVMAVLDIRDTISGKSTPVSVPLKEYAYSDYRWVDGFEFLITVKEADAGVYALGNELVPTAQTHPFAGYETALLRLIGVSPTFYRIDTVEWISNPRIGADGIVYRQAMARGAKQIATVRAVYEGSVTLETVQSQIVQAVYERNAAEFRGNSEDKLGEQADLKSGFDRLQDLLHWLFTRGKRWLLSVSFLLFWVFILVILSLLKRRKKTKKKKGSDKN